MLTLSICIPTYNRSSYLQRTLESILAQDGLAEIEVIISDNASDDNTAEIVESFVQRFPSIVKYYRNVENIQDANFERVMSLGIGRFLKLHNDTAVLRPGALSKILDVIKRADKNGLLPFFMNGNGSRDFLEGVADDLDEFVAITKYWNTWIGAFGVWRKDFGSVRGLMKEKSYTKLTQSWVLLSLIAKGKPVLINNEVFFDIIPVAKKGGYNIAEVFGRNYNEILQYYYEAEHLSLNILEIARRDILKFVNKFYFDINREYAFQKTGYYKWVLPYYRYQFYFYRELIKIHANILRRNLSKCYSMISKNALL